MSFLISSNVIEFLLNKLLYVAFDDVKAEKLKYPFTSS